MKTVDIIKKGIGVLDTSNMTIAEILKKLGLDNKKHKNLSSYCKLNNIQYKVNDLGYPKIHDFKLLYDEKGDSLSIEEYAIKFNVSILNISGMLVRLGYKSKSKSKVGYSKREKESILFNDQDYQMLIGSLLGDGSISKTKHQCNSRLTIKHSIKQKEYIKYKQSLMSFACSYTESTRIDNREKWPNIQKGVIITSSQNKSFNCLREKWYPQDIKIVNREMFNSIEGLGMAIWFMDDGCKIKDTVCLATMSFTRSDVEYMKKVLYNKFGIICTIHKTNNIRISKQSYPKFKNLVLPFMHESLLYKLP